MTDPLPDELVLPSCAGDVVLQWATVTMGELGKLDETRTVTYPPSPGNGFVMLAMGIAYCHPAHGPASIVFEALS